MEIDHVFASGAVVGRATTHSWGRPAPRCARSDGRPHSCVVARPTTAPDAKTWSIPTGMRLPGETQLPTGKDIMGSSPGPRFTNGFSIAIQIRWKLRFALISIQIKWSLKNFVHGTTAVLSWHVQKFVAIWWPVTELQQGEVSIEFELRAKNR